MRVPTASLSMAQAALTAAVLLSTVARGQDAASLLPGAPNGAVETASLDEPLGVYDLPVAALGAGEDALERLTGQIAWRAFRLDGADLSTELVAEAYRRQLREGGWDIRFDCRSDACGGVAFRFEAMLLPAPEMAMDSADFVQISAKRQAADEGQDPQTAPDHLSVLISEVLGQVFIQSVAVRAGAVSLPALAPSDAGSAAAPVPGREGMVLPSREDALLARLRRDGHVPVAGLAFETGGTTLSAASAPALDQLAALLRADKSLSVMVVGHSDNEGTLEANIALSERRAQAVVDGLVERGVGARQLSAHGVGFLAPVTANDSDGGRARNRRVELVLR